MAGVRAGIVERWEDAVLKSAGSSKLIMLTEPQDFVDLTNCIRIGHPSGLMTVYVDKEGTGKNIHFNGVAAQRTARRIMDGYILET